MTLVNEHRSSNIMPELVKSESPAAGKRQFNLDDFARKRPKSEPETSGSQEAPVVVDVEDTAKVTQTIESKNESIQTPFTPVKVDASVDLTTPEHDAQNVPPDSTKEPSVPLLELPQIESSQEYNRMSVEPQEQTPEGELPNIEKLDSNSQKPLTQKQLERLEKQKIREKERLEREKKKEEERILKKLERERKDQERLLKKQKLEEEKERKREEERQRREEKKRKADEERKRKEQERLKKDEEKKRKEEERKQLEEERKKQEEQKERSQKKISNFFSVKPAVSKQKASAPIAKSPNSTVPEVQSSLYEKDFLPFFIKRNALMAPTQSLSKADLEDLIRKFDESLSSSNTASLSEMFPKLAISTQHSIFTTSEELAEALNSTSSSESTVVTLIKNLPNIKYLQFYENAKPPYVGTWCSQKHSNIPFKASNPLDTSLTGYDYNYDSDLDWQDGDEGDGEDIDDLEDGDDDEDLNEDEEMDDFVENNNEKRRLNLGPMEAVTILNDGSNPAIFDNLQVRLFQPQLQFPIDPTKDYWGSTKTKISTPSKASETSFSVSQLKATPVQDKSPSGMNILTPQKPTIQDKLVVQELIAFIEKNSDFTIGTLSELAKKEFKNYTKSILKHTIQDVAVYNKKQSLWEIKEGAKEKA